MTTAPGLGHETGLIQTWGLYQCSTTSQKKTTRSPWKSLWNIRVYVYKIHSAMPSAKEAIFNHSDTVLEQSLFILHSAMWHFRCFMFDSWPLNSWVPEKHIGAQIIFITVFAWLMDTYFKFTLNTGSSHLPCHLSHRIRQKIEVIVLRVSLPSIHSQLLLSPVNIS